MKEDNPVLQNYKIKHILDELSKMPSMVIETAYLHAINFELYGVDVTKEWVTATQNASALSRAYEKGICEGWKRQLESEADIAFNAYQRGYADAKKDIREGLEKLTAELSTNEFTSAIMRDFYNNVEIIIEGEKVDT